MHSPPTPPDSLLRVTVLGCGSSGGVPRIGGDWGECDPANPRNQRRRCALLVERIASAGETTRVLVDAGPDLRLQCLDAGIRDLDAVLLTHEHADHIHGLDELRVLYLTNGRRRIPVWAAPRTARAIRKQFGYAFDAIQGSPYSPFLDLQEFEGSLDLDGPGGPIHAESFAVPHGSITSLGFRFGPLAYVPDISAMSEAAWRALAGVDTWIVDALQRDPHPTHAHLSRTMEWINRLAPRRAILTNMHVHLDYATLVAETPAFVVPAHDGMVVAFALSDPPVEVDPGLAESRDRSRSQ